MPAQNKAMLSDTFTVKLEMNIFEFCSAMYFQMSKMKMIKRLFLLSLIIGILNGLLDAAGPGTHVLLWYQILLKVLFPPVFILLFFVVFGTLGAILLLLLKSNLFNNVTYYFTHWGMEKDGKGFSITMQWSKFLKFTESTHFIFLYISENDAHIVQKRMFNNKAELERFRQFILEQIK